MILRANAAHLFGIGLVVFLLRHVEQHLFIVATGDNVVLQKQVRIFVFPIEIHHRIVIRCEYGEVIHAACLLLRIDSLQEHLNVLLTD